MSMDQLRQGATNINQPKNSKGSIRSAYYTRWKPPQIVISTGMGKRTTFDLRPFLASPPHEESKVESAEMVVLIPGEYEDIYAVDSNGTRILPPPKQEGLHVRVHNFNVFMKPRNPTERGYSSIRELVCSSGPEPHAPQPCVGCYKVDHGEKDSRPRDAWVFNIAHLSWYHLIPFVKDGQIQMKKDGSGPIMIKVECPNYKPENIYLGRALQAQRAPVDIAKKYKKCDACEQGAAFTWGDHRTLQVGFKHLKNIFAIDDQVGKRCLNCGTNILRVAFDCTNCNTELVDLAQVSWTNDQIEQYLKTPQQCSCGCLNYPKSIYECGFNDDYTRVADPCANPQKTSIFDCVLWIQREGESTESSVVVKRVELISQYKTQDGRPLFDHLQDIVKEPFDLTEMYKSESLEDQANLLRMDNPFAQQSYDNQHQGGYAQTTPNNYQPPGAPQTPQVNYPQPGRPNYGR